MGGYTLVASGGEFDVILLDGFPATNHPICDIHWWGAYTSNFGDCSVPADVEIRFYDAANGAPNHLIASYRKTLIPTATCVDRPGFDRVYRFDVELEDCVNLPNGGFVSVSSASNTCNFSWLESYEGDNNYYFLNTETGLATERADVANFAFCLTTTGARGNALHDFGDAPDSTFNHWNFESNLAYEGIVGSFPTVWELPSDAPAQEPSGPRHVEPLAVAWLGPEVSLEQAADTDIDSDLLRNILDDGVTLPADVADRDTDDDGWPQRPDPRETDPQQPEEECRRERLIVHVSHFSEAQVIPEIIYLNVWMDLDRDGDWDDDQPDCDPEDDDGFAEWIVRDYEVDVRNADPDEDGLLLTVVTEPYRDPTPLEERWVRFTLSEQPAPLNPQTGSADGRGPRYPDSYQYGETEDYLWRPSSIDPTPRPIETPQQTPVGNTPPPEPEISPVLAITISGNGFDEDDDNIYYIVVFSSDSGNDPTIIYGPTPQRSFLLEEGATDATKQTTGAVTFDAGERWTVDVTPVDEHGSEGGTATAIFVVEEDGGILLEGWQVK